MPITVDGVEYFTVGEACEYLGGVTRQTLRNRTKAAGIYAYKQGISRSVYYRKPDLDRLKEFHPVKDDEDETE
jgi:Helix-turn-helix domain